MYKQKPWTLDKKSRINKSPYIKNREADLAISTARVQKLFKENKDKTYSNNEISSILGMSLGTVSEITNRLEAIQDIKIVRVRQLKSALSQVFQHYSGSYPPVFKERGKEDSIVSVHALFTSNINKVFTKNELLQNLDNSEGKVRRSIQILLLDGHIKLVGSTENGQALYQHKDGNKKGIEIYQDKDDNYITLSNYLKNNNLKEKRSYFKHNLRKKTFRLFYSNIGLLKEYLIEDLDKIKGNMNKKGFLTGIFS